MRGERKKKSWSDIHLISIEQCKIFCKQFTVRMGLTPSKRGDRGTPKNAECLEVKNPTPWRRTCDSGNLTNLYSLSTLREIIFSVCKDIIIVHSTKRLTEKSFPQRMHAYYRPDMMMHVRASIDRAKSWDPSLRFFSHSLSGRLFFARTA